MTLRRKSREYALQMLFQWEMGKQEHSRIEDGFWKNARAQKSTREFANQLFENAAARAAELDPIISSHAQNWRLERMAAIDRAILRLALAEMRTTSTPAKVVINEAVDLAKKFSSEDASAFINGILDAAAKSFGEKTSASLEIAEARRPGDSVLVAQASACGV
jgi:N utilization substance protein B